MMRFEPEEILNHDGLPAYLRTAAKQRLKLFDQFDRNPETIEPNQKVWKKLKETVLGELTNGRCMYCELSLKGGAHLDVEHYRPKKDVTETDLEKVRRTRDGLQGHGGYWWLAYEWQNLLLSCKHCNAYHPSGEGKHPGKSNEFPVAGRRVFPPPTRLEDPEALEPPSSWWQDLEGENPQILHPYYDDPFDHFELDPNQLGVLRGKTDRGRWTIEVLDLNRDELIEARAVAARKAGRWRGRKRDLHEEFEELVGDSKIKELLAGIEPVPKRGHGFSFYVELYLRNGSDREPP